MGDMMVWRPPEAPEGRPACLSRGAAIEQIGDSPG